MIKPCHSTQRKLSSNPPPSPLIVLVESNDIKLQIYNLTIVVYLRKENIYILRGKKRAFCYKISKFVVHTKQTDKQTNNPIIIASAILFWEETDEHKNLVAIMMGYHDNCLVLKKHEKFVEIYWMERKKIKNKSVCLSVNLFLPLDVFSEWMWLKVFVYYLSIN